MQAHIRQSIEGVVRAFTDDPDQARSADSPARATIVQGPRCRTVGPNGITLLSDMPHSPVGDALRRAVSCHTEVELA